MRRSSRKAFTLVEILIVVVIVLIVSAVALPTIVSAVGGTRIDEAARILQAALVGARDRAIHAGKPAGIRLIPDPNVSGNVAAANKIIDIQQGPDYSEGRVTVNNIAAAPVHPGPPAILPLNWNDPATSAAPVGHVIVYEEVNDPVTLLPNSPTSWYWNIRVGDRFRFHDSGRFYTVVGPMSIPWGAANPEGYVNIGAAGTLPAADQNAGTTNPEFLYLVNGIDDNGDGFIDNGADGVDNNLNGTIDEAGEAEAEVWLGAVTNYTIRTVPTTTGTTQVYASTIWNVPYSIERQPVPVQSAREITLPAGAVVDLTTSLLGHSSERSRVPIDPNTLFVDILVNPNGTWVPTTRYSSPSSAQIMHAFHFWIAERQDLHEDVWGFTTNPTPPPAVTPNTNPNAGQTFILPMPQGTTNYTPNTFLTGDRRLVTFFPRTGVTVTNTIENFDVTNINAPYLVAEQGVNAPK